MRTLAEVQRDRTEAIRRDYSYRMRLAMRDNPDYSNDEPVKEPKVIFRPRPIGNEVDQLKAEVKYLRSKVSELQQAKKPKKKSSSYKGLSVE